MKVTDLPEDRQLDVAVAMHVFGWRWLTVRAFGVIAILFPPGWYDEERTRPWSSVGVLPGAEIDIDSRRFNDSRSGPSMPQVPHYSQNDTLALHAADAAELFEQGYVLMRVVGAYTQVWAWHVAKNDSGGVPQSFLADENRATVICQAAVKAAIFMKQVREAEEGK